MVRPVEMSGYFVETSRDTLEEILKRVDPTEGEKVIAGLKERYPTK